MSEFHVIMPCGTEKDGFDSKDEAEDGAKVHTELCESCSDPDAAVIESAGEPMPEQVADGGTTATHEPDEQVPPEEAGVREHPPQPDEVQQALDKEHAERTEWWSRETKRVDEVRSEILASVMLREDVQLVRRGTDTDLSGVHELSFTVRVQGVPFEEFEVNDE